MTEVFNDEVASLDRKIRVRGASAAIVGVSGFAVIAYFLVQIFSGQAALQTKFDQQNELTRAELAAANAQIKALGGRPVDSVSVPGTPAKIVPIKGPPGRDGRDGENGRNGEDGRDGRNGDDGRGVEGPEGSTGESGPKGDPGSPGPVGPPGAKGEAGRGVTSASCEQDGLNLSSLAITFRYSDGTSETIKCTEESP